MYNVYCCNFFPLQISQVMSKKKICFYVQFQVLMKVHWVALIIWMNYSMRMCIIVNISGPHKSTKR